jgi:hypothetical protein
MKKILLTVTLAASTLLAGTASAKLYTADEMIPSYMEMKDIKYSVGSFMFYLSNCNWTWGEHGQLNYKTYVNETGLTHEERLVDPKIKESYEDNIKYGGSTKAETCAKTKKLLNYTDEYKFFFE